MPVVTPMVAVAFVWKFMYNPQIGTINQIFGLDVNWLMNPKTALLAIMIMTIWKDFGYAVVMYMAGLYSLPTDALEAAKVDGANAWQTFRYITLPLLKGVFRTNITMWSVTSVGFFVWSQLFSTVTADTQTITPMVYLYMQIFGAGNSVTERNSGIGAAVGVMLSVCVVAVFWLCNHLLKDDELEF